MRRLSPRTWLLYFAGWICLYFVLLFGAMGFLARPCTCVVHKYNDCALDPGIKFIFHALESDWLPLIVLLSLGMSAIAFYLLRARAKSQVFVSSASAAFGAFLSILRILLIVSDYYFFHE